MATPQAQPPSSASSPEPRCRRLAFLDSVHGPVFYPAVAILLTVVLSAVIFPNLTSEVFNGAQRSVIRGIGWYYTLAFSGFVIFALWMGIGRFGAIKLGQDDDDAEFSLMAWFAMLFAAGMAIGLVFWGAAEPLTFFTTPKPGTTGSDADLANAAMSQVFLHWGFHPWAIYVVVGLAMAYAIHRKGRSVPCAGRSSRSSATTSRGASVTSWTSPPSSEPWPVSPRRWALVSSRSPPAWRASASWTSPPTRCASS